MKLTPIKKIIIALVVMVVVVSVVTANNMTSIMMIKAAMNAKENIPTEYSTYYYKVTTTGSASAGGSAGGSGTAATTAASGSSSGGSGSAATTAASGSGSSSTTAPAGGNGGEAAKPGAKPESKTEIIAYFNKAVNAVKSDAKVVKQQSVTNYLASATKIGDGLSGIYNMLGGDSWLDGMLQENSQGAKDLAGADIVASFPVEGQTWSSKLEDGDVSNAVCSEAGGVYTIEITTVEDAASANHTTGQGHAPKAFNVVLPGVVNDNIPSLATSIVGNCEMAYPASTVKVTVDAATGHVLTAEYDLKWTIIFASMDTELPFGTKAIYNIEW